MRRTICLRDLWGIWVKFPEVGHVPALCERPVVDLTHLDPAGRELHKKVHVRGFTVDTVRSPGTKGLHRHASVEMTFVHSGASVWRVGKWARVVMPGDVLVFDARSVHGSRPIGGHYVRTTLHFKPSCADRTISEKLPLNERTPWFVSLSDASMAQVVDALKRLRNCGDVPECQDAVRKLLADIVGEVYDAFSHPRQSRLHPVVREVLDYMTTRLNSDESLSELANRFFISEGHLCHLFRTHFGCSPLRLWQLIKIEGACYSLLSQDKSVFQLAAEVGYSSRRGFQRAFRRVTGMTVEAYRNQLIEEISLSV